MKRRHVVVVLTTVILLGSALVLVADQARTTAGAASTGGMLRTPWGEPDLEGIWNGETLTPLERPARWADRPVLSAEEARAVEEWVESTPGRDDRSQRGQDRELRMARELQAPIHLRVERIGDEVVLDAAVHDPGRPSVRMREFRPRSRSERHANDQA